MPRHYRPASDNSLHGVWAQPGVHAAARRDLRRMSREGSCRVSGDAKGWPSDDSGAIGPDRYLQSVNLALSVYDRAGKLIAGPVRSDTFWSALSTDPNLWDPAEGTTVESCNDRTHTDAVVLYDRQADRWLVSRPGGADPDNGGAGDGRLLCLAVSQTSDPAGQYNQYAFLINSKSFNTEVLDFSFYFNDYPKPGIWQDAYYVAANVNRIFTGIGNTVSAFDRSAMLAGDHQPGYVTFFVPAPSSDLTRSHMLPADLDGNTPPPTGTPEYVVQVQDANLGFFPPPGHLQVREFHVDWTNPALSTLTPTTSLTPQTFNSNVCPQQSCIPQPKTTNVLDSLSYGLMMYRLSYRNFGDHQMLLFNHTVAAEGDPTKQHAGIRWYELRNTIGAPWSIYQQGTYAPDSNDRWLGSVAMDNGGNIALGFDVSSKTVFPSIHYVGRRNTDPLSQLPVQETSLIDGSGSQIGLPADPDNTPNPFFGDYSQMTLDPTDDCTFWYTNTYYPQISNPESTDPDNWHTRIGAFRFPSCFESFTLVPVLGIDLRNPQVKLRALLDLNAHGAGINPLTEDVTLQLGTFSITIPAGSFTKEQHDDEGSSARNPHGAEGSPEHQADEVTFKFTGVIGTVHLQAEISRRQGHIFEFNARGEGATGLPTTNPVTVALTIGHDKGATTVAAEFKSEEVGDDD